MGNNFLSWSSKTQPTISRSSAEAEYHRVANVVSESCWLRNLLCELHHPPHKSTLVYCDNISTVYLSTDLVQHQRTKHIEIDIHFVREKVARGELRFFIYPSYCKLLIYLQKAYRRFYLKISSPVSTSAILMFRLRGCISML